MTDLRVSFPKPCNEKWDDMRPQGCDRFCQRCDNVIHDLSKLTFGEVEELARSASEICVRAQVQPDGVVQLRSSRPANGRRMIAAIGASASLVASGTPASASGSSTLGAIKGEVIGSCGTGSVVAVAADGRTYRAKVGFDGRYKVKRLPAGNYEVRVDQEGAKSSVGIRVEAGRTTAADVQNADPCIVIGMLKMQADRG